MPAGSSVGWAPPLGGASTRNFAIVETRASPSWPIGWGSGRPGVPPIGSPSRSFRSLGRRKRKWSALRTLYGPTPGDADADEREVLQPEEPPGREPAFPRHPAATPVVAVPHLAAAVGADLGPRRIALAALDDGRVGIERHPPERRVPREHDRVAAPVEEPAHGVHRLERPVFAVPDDEQHAVAVQDVRIEMQVGVAEDVVVVALRLQPDLREPILAAEVAVVPLLGAHERVGPDDRPGHPEADLVRPLAGADAADRSRTPAGRPGCWRTRCCRSIS